MIGGGGACSAGHARRSPRSAAGVRLVHLTERARRAGVWLAHLPIARPVALASWSTNGVRSGGSRAPRGSAWPALIGAAAAVTGVVAIVTVNHGLTDAVAHPEVAGVAWDASVYLSRTTCRSPPASSPRWWMPSPSPRRRCRRNGRLATSVRSVSSACPVFTVIDPDDGAAVHLVTLSGRAPRSDDEIVLGPSTARDLGVNSRRHREPRRRRFGQGRRARSVPFGRARAVRRGRRGVSRTRWTGLPS